MEDKIKLRNADGHYEVVREGKTIGGVAKVGGDWFALSTVGVDGGVVGAAFKSIWTHGPAYPTRRAAVESLAG